MLASVRDRAERRGGDNGMTQTGVLASQRVIGPRRGRRYTGHKRRRDAPRTAVMDVASAAGAHPTPDHK